MSDAEPGSEAALVRSARHGDATAFESLCERYRVQLEARVKRRLADAIQRKVSVQDVLQETYIAAFDRVGGFEDRGEGAFGAWIAQIAEFKAREAVRHFAGTERRAVDRETPVDGHDGDREPQGRDATPSQVAIAVETSEAAARALRRLPPDYRQVLELVQVRGVPLVETARLLCRSYEATKKLYGRAMQRFTLALAAQREEPRDGA
jgi:RNA polymerase sigma-70 factor (ECF subfamily)